MRAVIAAGGRGSRLASVSGELPKAMVSICGVPIIERQINSLVTSGIDEIMITVGYRADAIIERIGDGSRLGARVEYFKEESPLGSAGALASLKEWIETDFLLLLGDLVLDVDFTRFIKYHREKQARATLFVHPNSHPFDSDLVIIGESGNVTGWMSKRDTRPFSYRNIVNAGIYMLNRESIASLVKGESADLERDIVLPAIADGRVFAYQSSEYVKDAGTPERLALTQLEWERGIPEARNLSRRQHCVFLDRDGTLNKHRGFLTRAEEIELERGAACGVAKLNASGCLVIVITNQPVLARGECSAAELARINARIETLLGEKGAYLDDLLFCPHHPDRGFEREVARLKIDCECRKPKIGLLREAAARWNIELRDSWFVGDTTTDIQTGINACCRTALLQTGECGLDGKYDVQPDLRCDDLEDFARVMAERW